MLDAYLELLDQDYFELKEAFKGLKDENVWKRPAPGLLSIGEISGHIAYWEANRFAGEGKDGGPWPDPEKCKVQSLLIDPRFSYYTSSIESSSPSDEHLAMTAEQVCNELVRINDKSVANLKTLTVPLDSFIPGWTKGFDFKETLKYTIFHIAYHTGQIYSARHLLGEETPDN